MNIFMHIPKIVQIGWVRHVNFCVWKKSTITFGEGCRNYVHINGPKKGYFYLI